MNAEIRIGISSYMVDGSDRVLDDGHCYLLVTKQGGHMLDGGHPCFSKRQFAELLQAGILFTDDSLRNELADCYAGDSLYAFDIGKMEHCSD